MVTPISIQGSRLEVFWSTNWVADVGLSSVSDRVRVMVVVAERHSRVLNK